MKCMPYGCVVSFMAMTALVVIRSDIMDGFQSNSSVRGANR